MIDHPLAKVLIAFLLIIINHQAVQAQESILDLPISQQVKFSDLIIEGEIVRSESFWDTAQENMFTSLTIKPYKLFKGNIEKSIKLIVPGGVIGLTAERVSHSIKVNSGESGIFFLKKLASSNSIEQSKEQVHYLSVAGDQSFIRYDVERNLASNIYTEVKSIKDELYPEIIASLNGKQPMVLENFIELDDVKINPTQRISNTSISLSSFSTTDNTAGTRDILTINGSGFGNNLGTIKFSNADYGGYIQTEVLETQITDWSDDKIEVEIPEFAGTGKFSIISADGNSIESNDILDIKYAHTNLNYDLGEGNTAFSTRHIGQNGNGGYTWSINQGFINTEANDAFLRAFNNLACQSGINWKVDDQATSINREAKDGINIITFDQNNQLSAGKLAQCRSRYEGCFEDGRIIWYITEMDIVFNDAIDWNFSQDTSDKSKVDLESVALHELGHAHQLNHVVDDSKVMHYSFASGDVKRELNEDDLEGVKKIQEQNTLKSVCEQPIMQNVSCSTLSDSDINLDEKILLYPNPANNHFYIRNNQRIVINELSIISLQGKHIRTVNDIRTTNKIDVSKLSQGIYIIKITSENGILNKKIVIR